MRSIARARMVGVALAVLVVACDPSGVADEDGADRADDTGRGASGELIVFAAASLTDAFDEIRAAFVTVNPDVEVVVNLAGSQTLARQIIEGASADVFASANVTQMDAVADAGGLAGDPAVFTSNVVAIAVEPGNPLGVAGLEDLADPGLLLVLPAEEVPAGRYAREALDAAEVEVTPVSLEQNVRAALAKVELGEADATIVYASDLVTSDGRAQGIAIPTEQNVPATYPIAILADAPNPTAAEAFVTFVLSDAGQEILAAHGFAAP